LVNSVETYTGVCRARERVSTGATATVTRRESAHGVLAEVATGKLTLAHPLTVPFVSVGQAAWAMPLPLAAEHAE
jgi:hypothetical protein